MVLTTVPIEQLASDKITPIHHLLDDGELAAIERRFFAPQDDLRGEIAEFFRRDCFYAGKTLTSRDDILMFLTGELRAKGLMDAAEQASVFEREKASPTEIGHLVAIPHPIYAAPVRSTIAVLTLEKPVVWEAQRVQVVFLISIAKTQLLHWQTIFLKLFDYLVKQDGVLEILRHPTYDDFLQSFTQAMEK